MCVSLSGRVKTDLKNHKQVLELKMDSLNIFPWIWWCYVLLRRVGKTYGTLQLNNIQLAPLQITTQLFFSANFLYLIRCLISGATQPVIAPCPVESFIRNRELGRKDCIKHLQTSGFKWEMIELVVVPVAGRFLSYHEFQEIKRCSGGLNLSH